MLIRIICFIMILIATDVYAEMYRWTDEKGIVHITDSPAKVPDSQKYDRQNFGELWGRWFTVRFHLDNAFNLT